MTDKEPMSWLGMPLSALINADNSAYPERGIWQSKDGKAYHLRDLEDRHLCNLHAWAKRTRDLIVDHPYDRLEGIDLRSVYADRLDEWVDKFEVELRRRASQASQDFP